MATSPSRAMPRFRQLALLPQHEPEPSPPKHHYFCPARHTSDCPGRLSRDRANTHLYWCSTCTRVYDSHDIAWAESESRKLRASA